MSPNDVLADLRRQPFEPFQLIMTDGASFEIQHPDQCLVLTTALIVGLKTQPGQETSDRYVKIDCRHVSRIHYLPPATAPGKNGQHPA
jgi:hypothetical protein